MPYLIMKKQFYIKEELGQPRFTLITATTINKTDLSIPRTLPSITKYTR